MNDALLAARLFAVDPAGTGVVLRAGAGRVAGGVARDDWSWGNRQREGAQAFAQGLSAKANSEARAARLWDLSAAMIGRGAPSANA